MLSKVLQSCSGEFSRLHNQLNLKFYIHSKQELAVMVIQYTKQELVHNVSVSKSQFLTSKVSLLEPNLLLVLLLYTAIRSKRRHTPLFHSTLALFELSFIFFVFFGCWGNDEFGLGLRELGLVFL